MNALTHQLAEPNAAIEAVANFWNRQPCNIRHSAKPVGSREYFDEVEARRYFVYPHIPAFAQFEHWRGKSVLEIGCGIGTDTIRFAQAGAEVTAVDLSYKSLEIARRRADVYGVSSAIRFHQANAEELSATLPIKPYDLIYSAGAIHHTPNPERVVGQLCLYSRPGTVLKVLVYHRHSWRALEILFREGHGKLWRFSKLLARHSEAQVGSPVTYSYTRRSVRELLQGFTIDSAAIEHIFPYQVPEYLRYRYVKVWYFRYLPDGAFRWLAKHVGWHLCVTAHFPGALAA